MMFDTYDSINNKWFRMSDIIPDINECIHPSYNHDNGNCSNTNGSWIVTCHPGFKASHDQTEYNKSCVGMY